MAVYTVDEAQQKAEKVAGLVYLINSAEGMRENTR